jgi:hypothetical protein
VMACIASKVRSRSVRLRVRDVRCWSFNVSGVIERSKYTVISTPTGLYGQMFVAKLILAPRCWLICLAPLHLIVSLDSVV